MTDSVHLLCVESQVGEDKCCTEGSVRNKNPAVCVVCGACVEAYDLGGAGMALEDA